MNDAPQQLALLAYGAQVPQANSLRRLIALIEDLADQERTLPEAAEVLGVEERTARWYLDLARWLGFVRPVDDDQFELTPDGATFADNVAARGRLLSQALFDKEVVRLANAYKRQALDDDERVSAREACRRAIERTTDLAETTVERRASSLARLLEAAYAPSRVDWATGRRVDRGQRAPLEFAGESFLTAFGVKKLGVEHRMLVGFPRQVHQFACGRPGELEPTHWKRASYRVEADVQWFGSVPVNDASREIALRGGRDLRQLLVVTAPYIALWCAFATIADPLERPRTQTTLDLFGPRLWFEQVELGPPIEVLDELAERLGLEPRHEPPHLRDSGGQLGRPAEHEHLLEVLIESGIARRRDTVVELAPGVADQWREGSDDNPSVEERLAPLRDEIRDLLRQVDWNAEGAENAKRKES